MPPTDDARPPDPVPGPRRRGRVAAIAAERGLWVFPALSLVGGALLVLVTLQVDQGLLAGSRLPGLPLDLAAVRALVGGIAGASVTATAVVFWVRGMLVSLASSRFAPRLLTGLLSDAWQTGATAVMTGMFGVAATALLGFPGPDDPAGVPVLTLLVVLAWTAVALVVMAGIIDASVRAIHGDRVVDDAVERTAVAVDRTIARRSAPGQLPVPEEADPRASLRADCRGWVVGIDHDALVGRGWRCVELNCAVGSYVEVGTVLLQACPDEGELTALRSAIRVEPVRRMDTDPTVGLRALADTAVRAFTDSSRDTPTALAAVASLSALLTRILMRDGHPVVERRDGTVVIRRIRLVPEDLVAVALDPLLASDLDGATIAQVIRLLDSARESLESAGGRLDPLEEHVRVLVDEGLHRASPRDRELILSAARPWQTT
ncbi:DUF2254 family protein [Euzebya sp.]|uniref:DUF2254 family protein n=1 Tax=Euzebya sp. TaxID=1971409 RepID=UPI00351752B4